MNTKEQSKIKNYIEKLKSSTSQAYEALLGIRAYIGKSKNGIKILKENGMLKYLVHFLHKPNEKIIDMTLSILGTCCLDSMCRKEVVNHGALNPLAAVLQNIARDSIQGRACRLIGNLAQEHTIACELHKEGVVAALVAILEPDSKSSAPTQQMAIRALRMLWCVEQQRESMLESQAVYATAQLLSVDIKQREDEDLVQGAVKALATFTYQCSEACTLQVNGDGTGFQDLVALASKSSTKSFALICISNLCQIASCRYGLGVAGAVKSIIEEITALEEGTNSKLMLALCLLCRDAFTRHKIVCAGGLPLMVAAARNSASTSMHPQIFHALMQFVYDDNGMQALINAGLVEVLVQKLEELVKQHGKIHSACKPAETVSKRKNKNNKKRKTSDSSDLRELSISSKEHQDDKECVEPKRRFRASSPSYQAVVQEQEKEHGQGYTCIMHGKETSPTLMRISSPGHSPASSGYNSCSTRSPDYYWDWSPGSPNNMCISSESHSPVRRTWSSSPTPSWEMDETNFTDDDFPEVYSPVFQEDSECDNDKEDQLHEVDESMKEGDKDGIYVNEEPEADENLPTTSSTSISPAEELGPLLVLLFRISSLGKKVTELATPATFDVLIDCIRLINRPINRAMQILLSIIRNAEYFLPLIQHEFVFMVNSRLCQRKHSECVTCDILHTNGISLISELSCMAQSGFGVGTLAHGLLKNVQHAQALFAVTIPFVIKHQKSLKFLLLECGGLEIMFSILSEDYPPEYIINSLFLLATSLGISNPQKQNAKNNSTVIFTEKESNSALHPLISDMPKDAEDTIILKLDDGTSISSSKTALSLSSPMFEAMFQGGFRESNEKCVPIPEISNLCLSHLLQIMKIGEQYSTFNNIDLPTAMELLAALNRFLIPGGDSLRKLIVDKYLSPETAVYIYEYSIEAGENPHFHILCSATLSYMLTEDTSSKQRHLMFIKLLNSSYSKKAVEDIKYLLIKNLTGATTKELSIS